MSWKPWEYEGYEYDDSISLYLPLGKGIPACTPKYMATYKSHLRIKHVKPPTPEEHHE